MTSIQRKLLKIRPPRVKITYDVEVGNVQEERELPFVMGIVSDLYGQQQNRIEYKYRQFINIDKDNINAIMSAISPSLSLKVNNVLLVKKDQKLICNLIFKTMDDFKPDQIAAQIPECKGLLADRKGLVDLLAKVESNEKLSRELIDIAKFEKAIDIGKATSIATSCGLISSDDSESVRNRKAEMVMSFDRQVKGLQVVDIYGTLMRVIASIDDQLSKQIDEVLHDPIFQGLEGRWRSLYDLILKADTGPFLRIRVLNASSEELLADMSRAPEFDQSRLFKMVYEEEYGTMGGIPFSCLLLDEYFGKSSRDIEFLTLFSQVAAAAHAPLLTGVKPSLFDLRSFMELHIPRDLSKIFDSSDAIEWNEFRDTDESRYVNLCLPAILTRAPYARGVIKSFNYCESVDGELNDKFCWGNAAYALAGRINEAVSKYGWAAAIRGVEGGGLVSDLPSYTFRTSFADIIMKCPTQSHITDRREKELSDLGFICLCHKKMSSQAVFFSGQSAHRPPKYPNPESNSNAIISARLPYVINASRFVHYIKVIMRDKIGTFQSPKQIENYIQDWVARYVLLSDDADQETKAEYPLREAEILVSELPDRPGEYSVLMRLRPHFQLESAQVSVRFVGKVMRETE